MMKLTLHWRNQRLLVENGRLLLLSPLCDFSLVEEAVLLRYPIFKGESQLVHRNSETMPVRR